MATSAFTEIRHTLEHNGDYVGGAAMAELTVKTGWTTISVSALRVLF